MKAIIINPIFKKICGVSLVERTLNSLKDAGIKEVFVIGADRAIKPLEGVVVKVCADLGNIGMDSSFLLIKGDTLLDPRIIKEMAEREGQLLLLDEGPGDIPISVEGGKVTGVEEGKLVWTGIARLEATSVKFIGEALLDKHEVQKDMDMVGSLSFLADNFELGWMRVSDLATYVPKLRRSIRPYWFELKTISDVRRAEYRIIDGSQKDPSDLIARYVHNPIENWVVVRLANYPVTPNQVTTLVNLLAYVVTFLFVTGHLLIGSILTFAVGLMDGFDGKLARVKGMTTKVGSMEHPFDLLFEFSWILGLGFYLSRASGSPPLLLAALIVTLTAFYRNIYDRFGSATGMSLDVYGSFENRFRRIAGRRNLYNIHILAFVLLGRPSCALYSISIHALITAIIYSYRALKHLHAMDRGR